MALSKTGGPLRRACVRGQSVVVHVGRGGVGAQRHGLLQTAAVRTGQRQRFAAREAAVPGTAAVILAVQVGRQAAGILRPAAGEARVDPRAAGLAGERRGLAEAGGQAAGGLVGEVAGTRRDVELVLQPLSADEGVLREGDPLWKGAAAVGVQAEVGLGDDAGFLLCCAHGLVVLFGHVMLADQAPAQVAPVIVAGGKTKVPVDMEQKKIRFLYFGEITIWEIQKI